MEEHLTEEPLKVFELAVYHCLQQWTTLAHAIESGERDQYYYVVKFSEFYRDILNFFNRSKEARHLDGLEDLLSEYIDEGFKTHTFSESEVVEVAKHLWTVHEKCLLGNYENVMRMPAAASADSCRPLSTAEDDHAERVTNGDQHVFSVVPGEFTESRSMDVEMSSSHPSRTNVASSSKSLRRARVQLLTEEEKAGAFQGAPRKKIRSQLIACS